MRQFKRICLIIQLAFVILIAVFFMLCRLNMDIPVHRFELFILIFFLLRFLMTPTYVF